MTWLKALGTSRKRNYFGAGLGSQVHGYKEDHQFAIGLALKLLMCCACLAFHLIMYSECFSFHSMWLQVETWQHKLAMVVIDEGQQYGGDRKVASVAMLPPTCLVVWTGDAQQTPGGIAKGPSQIAITRRQLISRKHALRCPQDEYTPHTLFHAFMKIVSHLDLPVIADMEAIFQLAVTDLGPLWNPTEMAAHRES